MTSPSTTSDTNRAPHSVELKVRFAELDPYGHVNHAMYFSYLEFGRTEALAWCELEVDKMAAEGLQLVVTQIDARFRHAAGPNDILMVETSIGELKRASAVWDQRITRSTVDDQGATDTQVVMTGRITTGVTGVDGRPMRPPEWLFQKLAPITVSEPGEQ